MARRIDPLVVGKVVDDVIDMFVPTDEFTVSYGSKQVYNGCDIKPSATTERPHVQIHGARNPDHLFTLVMVDPDAPSPSEPKWREWLHWIVVDIPQGMDASNGKELEEYMGAQPPIGIHRYVFALFRQKGVMRPGIRLPSARNNFSTRQFAVHHDLGLAVAAVYFNSQKESMASRRR
ncbi:hypothetical protein Nepgr_007225 [Nepenthes gracilis]|uniref:Uncharacterized protein n=1 Tax=Nepenthes gracilis TaxID=150966 RepID=A0AAD3XI59_NEPGR|nr:hypothetical protein Nepgr_007225 [Nepenthes gracilis]